MYPCRAFTFLPARHLTPRAASSRAAARSIRHVSKTYDDGVIRPIVSPGLSALGLTIGRAAAGAGVGAAFGAAAADTAPAAAAPASRRTSRRVFIAESEDEADGHRHE